MEQLTETATLVYKACIDVAFDKHRKKRLPVHLSVIHKYCQYKLLHSIIQNNAAFSKLYLHNTFYTYMLHQSMYM